MGQEIVVYREDLMGKMMRNLIGVKPDLESADLKRYVSAPHRVVGLTLKQPWH
jgi:DNA polymerase epsilon subunit 2